ncbi:hypothetical protein [Acetobacter ghanensis]|uniref:Transmembrane protein n=2 Tax=Acetobacter ghanensis TaxID=431306 RepID=A0A0U5G127_9PROT|nr:hypothetical protein [Acetobacter ghanensis]GBQ47584.1 hypothetical protein AA18895_1109 [Acetobacter ghanensis DSM 18895]CEF57270.1 hypothetical protein AGA_2587 [Acetobacter ghanensis]
MAGRLPNHPATPHIDTMTDARNRAGANAPSELVRQRRMALLLVRLPDKTRGWLFWLREPRQKWLRLPTGILLIAGGLLSFLPILGLWMLPLGVALLAEDFALCRKASARMLDWVIRRKPHWLGIAPDETEEDAYSRIRPLIPPHHMPEMAEQAGG